MVLYLTEGLLNESVSGDEVIDAINNRTGVLITYSGEDDEHNGVRYIEPYVYGLTSKNNPAIRAYQYYGDTKRGVPAWKLLRLDRINSWKPTENHFDLEPQARGWAAQAFNGNDKLLPTIYKVVELNQNPQTDLEKLQARTRQLKQSKPLNINQLKQDNTPVQTTTSSTERMGGPIGNNNPNTGVESPMKTNQTASENKPLNTDGTPKNNETQPPVKQEPKQNGPIVGNATNPNENRPDDLMSNDKFKEMLKRNLELTDKEKEKRGFNIGNGQNAT